VSATSRGRKIPVLPAEGNKDEVSKNTQRTAWKMGGGSQKKQFAFDLEGGLLEVLTFQRSFSFEEEGQVFKKRKRAMGRNANSSLKNRKTFALPAVSSFPRGGTIYEKTKKKAPLEKGRVQTSFVGASRIFAGRRAR